MPLGGAIAKGGLSVITDLIDGMLPPPDAGLSGTGDAISPNLSGLSSPKQDDDTLDTDLTGPTDLSAGPLATTEESISGIVPLNKASLSVGSQTMIEDRPNDLALERPGHKHEHKKDHEKHKKVVPGLEDPDIESPGQKDYQ